MPDQNSQPTQYDSLATAYDLIWQVPAVRPLLPLLTSTIQSLGSFEGASVLDLACGTGIGLRVLRSLGATRLVGVDLSPQMLEVARETVPGATLHAGDCSGPLQDQGLDLDADGGGGGFDVVLGLWLLNYCPSAAELRGMWANAARWLRPGGHFVGVVENHDVALPASVATMRYGGMMSDVRDLDNGQGWSLHVAFDTQPVVEFDAFRLKPEILEREAAAAGFGEIRYSRPGWEDVRQAISEGIGGEEGKDEAWWTELIEAPPNYVIVTQKL